MGTTKGSSKEAGERVVRPVADADRRGLGYPVRFAPDDMRLIIPPLQQDEIGENSSAEIDHGPASPNL